MLHRGHVSLVATLRLYYVMPVTAGRQIIPCHSLLYKSAGKGFYAAGNNIVIKIGTSGFSYDDWVGPVYPPDLPAREHLTYYAERFPTVELNVTYYRVPEAHGRGLRARRRQISCSRSRRLQA